MKRILFIIISSLNIVFLSSCYDKSDNGLSIITTCFPPYDFSRAVIGSGGNVTMLLSPGAEAHSYEPSPTDIAKIRSCDLFVYIGGESEVWVEKIINSNSVAAIRLMDFVDPICTDEHEEKDDHDHGGEYDEHIWTSPENAGKMTKAICGALCRLDSENSAVYRKNYADYREQLIKLDEDFKVMTQNSAGIPVIIGDRFPLRYLADAYKFEYRAAFSGCSSETEPTLQVMAYLIDEINKNDCGTVFYLDSSTKKIAEKLSDSTGTQMLPLYSCHNVPKADFQNGITYIELMYKNLENLAIGLS